MSGKKARREAGFFCFPMLFIFLKFIKNHLTKHKICCIFAASFYHTAQVTKTVSVDVFDSDESIRPRFYFGLFIISNAVSSHFFVRPCASFCNAMTKRNPLLSNTFF